MSRSLSIVLTVLALFLLIVAWKGDLIEKTVATFWVINP